MVMDKNVEDTKSRSTEGASLKDISPEGVGSEGASPKDISPEGVGPEGASPQDTDKKDRSSKDEAFREESLHGNLWKLLFKVGGPLVFYSVINSLYNIADSIIASHINATAVSTVAYLLELSAIATAIGTGLALGGSVSIARAYGSGDYKLVSRLTSTLMVISLMAGGIVALMIPFSSIILRLSGTPEEMIEVGSTYFAVQLGTVAVTFLNTSYIAIEKARGKTKRIFAINTVVILEKLALTIVFVYVLNLGVTEIAVASLLSQCTLLIFGLFMLCQGNSAFRFRFKDISFKKDTVGQILPLGAPVMLERMVFSSGKVVVNSMCSQFGTLTVGGLGISNKYSGVMNAMGSGMQDGATSVISQNIGAGYYRRAVDAWKKTMIINIIFAAIGMVLLTLFLDPVAAMFATSSEGFNPEFYEVIKKITIYECLGAPIPCNVAFACLSMLYSLGKSKEVLVANLLRLFVFRILVLWGLMTFTDLGVECAGIVMVVSNVGYALVALAFTLWEIKKLLKEHPVDEPKEG